MPTNADGVAPADVTVELAGRSVEPAARAIERLAPRDPSTGDPAVRDLPPDLPPLETLTADSDFAPFMRAGVDADLRREALKKLLHDPRFNVMDGLDVYIDDYTKTTSIEPSLARELAARLHSRFHASEDDIPTAVVPGATVADRVVAEAGDGVPIDAVPREEPQVADDVVEEGAEEMAREASDKTASVAAHGSGQGQ